MNYKYTLIVKIKKGHIESYYGDDVKQLKEYAEFRKFNNYDIYELKKVGDKNDEKRSIIK